MKLRILKDEAFEIVKGTLELQKDLFSEVAVSGGVVLQVKRIQYHKVWVLQAIQLVEWPTHVIYLNSEILPIIINVNSQTAWIKVVSVEV